MESNHKELINGKTKFDWFFRGYGYFTVNTDNVDLAIKELETAMEDAGIEFHMNEFELRDV